MFSWYVAHVYYYYYYIYCTVSKSFALHFDQSSERLQCECKRTLITSRNRGLLQARGWGNRNSLGSLHHLLLLEEKKKQLYVFWFRQEIFKIRPRQFVIIDAVQFPSVMRER